MLVQVPPDSLMDSHVARPSIFETTRDQNFYGLLAQLPLVSQAENARSTTNIEIRWASDECETTSPTARGVRVDREGLILPWAFNSKRPTAAARVMNMDKRHII